MLDILCSYEWHESFGIMISVCVGFLYIPNCSFFLFRCIVILRKLLELCCSFSIVNFILVFTLNITVSNATLSTLVFTLVLHVSATLGHRQVLLLYCYGCFIVILLL
jgi:hypothetical protein